MMISIYLYWAAYDSLAKNGLILKACNFIFSIVSKLNIMPNKGKLHPFFLATLNTMYRVIAYSLEAKAPSKKVHRHHSASLNLPSEK